MKRSIGARAVRYAAARALRSAGAPRPVAWRAARKVTEPKPKRRIGDP